MRSLLFAAVLFASPLAIAAEPDLRCPPGTKLWTLGNGSEAHCETPNGVAEGPAYGRYSDGTLRYHGTSHAGKTTGTWTNWNSNGTLSIEAEYQDGELVGAFRRYDAHGVLQSEGNHDRKGRMDGTWTRYWPNGKVRTRWTMDGGRQQGPVETFYESGAKKSQGQRTDGQPVGEWTWFAEDGAVTQTCVYEGGRVASGVCGGPGAAQ
jgi:antitoxin component YwqK of YwqJK toxin-antitoxin module